MSHMKKSIGPILRRERDKRVYNSLFNNLGNKEHKKSLDYSNLFNKQYFPFVYDGKILEVVIGNSTKLSLVFIQYL